MAEGNSTPADDKQAPAAPVPGTPEYDAAMAEKAKTGGVTVNGEKAGGEGGQENKTGDETRTPVQRPAHIPEKFWNAEKGEADYEAMAKSYSELEKKLSEKPAEKKEGDPKEGEQKAETGEPVALREKANEEFSRDGKLSEDTIAEYEKHGITREQIDGYIEGQHALVQLRQREAFDSVGGKDQYEAMIAWARTALSQDEIEAYDRDVIGSRDAAVRTNAIKGLAARYEAENGKEGQLQGGTNSQATGDHFKSKSEMVKAMSDPRYRKDAAFRAEVAQKTANALKAGINLGVG